MSIPRPPTPTRWSAVAALLAVALLAGACIDGDPDAQQASPTEEPDQLADRTGPAADEDDTVADGSGDPTIDSDGEEPPAADAEAFSERLEQSGALATASDADHAILAQDDCAGLAVEIAGQYQTLLDELGDADRTDAAAIDLAFESPVLDGRLITGRADEVGCESDQLLHDLCQALPGLRPGGEVGDDVVANLDASCEAVAS